MTQFTPQTPEFSLKYNAILQNCYNDYNYSNHVSTYV